MTKISSLVPDEIIPDKVGVFLGMALSGVVSLVQEKILNDNQNPVFYLKDLGKLNQDRLKYLGVSEDVTGNANVTKLKEDIRPDILGLLEQRNG